MSSLATLNQQRGAIRKSLRKQFADMSSFKEAMAQGDLMFG
jgi:hypothetical protein